MNKLEHSCREASEYFKNLGDKARSHKNREHMYQISLDTLCSAVWIENMRKFEFMFAQMYPEAYEDVWRAVNDNVVSIDESSIYPPVLKFTSFTEKKGKWIPLSDGWASCSSCEHLERAAGLRWRYCPNCGARMEEKDET